MTKPSRSASKGRLARRGSSLRADSARMLMKPAKTTGSIEASVAPAITTSASSRWIVFKASPTAWLPVAQALANGHVRAFGAERDRHQARGGIRQEVRQEHGRDAIRPAFDQNLLLTQDLLDPARGGAQNHADALGALFIDLQASIGDGIFRCDQRKLRAAVHVPQLLRRECGPRA